MINTLKQLAVRFGAFIILAGGADAQVIDRNQDGLVDAMVNADGSAM